MQQHHNQPFPSNSSSSSSLPHHHHHQNNNIHQIVNHQHYMENPLSRINFRAEKQFLERREFYGKCRNVEEFEKLEKIFENVYKARDLKSNEIVALKRLDFSSRYEEGISLAYLREISYLQQFCQELKHGNILGLREMVVGSKLDSVFIVMDFIENDLTTVIDKSKRFALLESEIKCIMLQILEGVNYLHENLIIHRGIIKIIDFGLARSDTKFLDGDLAYGSSHQKDSIIEMFKKKTPNLITLWYRPLELLLGTLDYDKSIDMWSVGCIFAEILLRRPLFGADTEIQAFDMIFKLLGAPSESWLKSGNFPSASKYLSPNLLKKYENVNARENIRRTFSQANVDPKCIDLIEKLLVIDPKKRLTCKEALNHDYFKTYPLACSPKQLPSFIERDFVQYKRSSHNHRHLYDDDNYERDGYQHQQHHHQHNNYSTHNDQHNEYQQHNKRGRNDYNSERNDQWKKRK
ncbi:predicted protein [Naegleria gruberi]|uniref:Predicted protein n=1 Tax=Naegleria gruberi TaxID=5762 RepID=D2VSZ3_NAEGR|nr:uncharacterized protein NAEGRDRAFT_52009 [Naegleria gruberi]EFC39988.1 predicted protein [Naegleria gruberi]|eukprot:XP_002672732.1 predicted protein [Naegleria gruberi strain NEG-M]